MSKVNILFNELKDCNYHCTKCINKKVNSGQLAKVAQNLRDIGFQMEKTGRNFGKRIYCDICNETNLHYKLVSIEKKEPTVRFALSKSLRKIIIDTYSSCDAFDNSSLKVSEIEIDHRVTPKRENDINVTENDSIDKIKMKFMLLNKRHNNIKREVCKKCINTNIRQPSLTGLDFWYEGTKEYKGTCKGCFWAYPEEWVKNLKKVIS